MKYIKPMILSHPYKTSLFLLGLYSVFSWQPHAWKNYPCQQLPSYPNIDELEKVQDILRQKNPLVFAGEIRSLKAQLQRVEQGQQFIIQAGPCMEEIKDNQIEEIQRFFTLMIHASLILSFGLDKKVIRIGRIAGQYAKPRSELLEKDGSLTYRGDIIHSRQDRTPDPWRMMDAYYHSVSNLNAIRSFAKSGDLHLAHMEQWLYPLSEYNIHPYQTFQTTIQKSIQFIRNCGIYDYEALFKEPEFFSSHEALLLPYEEALTRMDSMTQQYYNCGAHTVWLGERTRHSLGHIEYLKGIENPIGIKIGPSVDVNQLVTMIRLLNPCRESGKIMLIFRLGDQVQTVFPRVVDAIRTSDLPVIYMCDPCHGNTQTMKGIKTRFLYKMHQELLQFFEMCDSCKVIPGGIHLEISGDAVTECIGLNVNYHDLSSDHYKTLVDPRLNPIQTLDTAFYVSSIPSKLSYRNPK